MKKILLMIAFIAGSVSFSMAQPGGGQRGGTPEEKTQRLLDGLKSGVTLTSEQEAQVKTIFIAQFKSQDSLRATAGEGADRQALGQKMMSIREASDKKIISLLTDDQKKAYADWQEKRRQRMGPGGQGGAPKPAGQ